MREGVGGNHTDRKLIKFSAGTCILVLPNISQVLMVEKLAQENAIPIDLIPTPREISSDCGMAALFFEEDLEQIKRLLDESSLTEGRFFYAPAQA